MLFAYRALDSLGKMMGGTVRADNENVLLQALAHQGYQVIEIRPALDFQAWFGREIARKPVRTVELINMTRQLGALLNAGVSLLPALELLQKQTSGAYLKKILRQVALAVGAGESFGDSLAKHRRVFSSLYIDVIRTGELTGALGRALQYLADFLNNEQKIKTKLRMAMIYPVILSLAALAVLIFIVNVVLPDFNAVFAQNDMQMPAITQFLLSTAGSDSFIFALLVAVLLTWCGWNFYLPHQPKLKVRIMRKLFTAPLLGKTATSVLSARMSRILGLLLRSGADLPTALRHTAEAVGNVAFADLLNRAELKVRRGESLTGALSDEVMLEPFITQLIATAEESGRLEEMLIYLADYYENAGTLQIDTLLALLEPLLILLSALVVGALVLGVLLPILGTLKLIIH